MASLPPQSDKGKHCERWQGFVERNILPLGLVVALAWSQLWPSHGGYLNHLDIGEYHAVTLVILASIFIISGMKLDVQDVTAPSALRGFVVGLFSILALCGSVGFIAVELPFDPPEYAIGLAVFCVSPIAPAFGLALVQQVKGNDALGALLTATTNVLGVVTMPLLVQAILRVRGLNIGVGKLLLRLAITLLIPLVCGKIVREAVPGAKGWIGRNLRGLGLTSSLMVIIFVWLILSDVHDDLAAMPPLQNILLVMAHIVVNFVFICINYFLGYVFALKPQVLKTVVILGSQKIISTGVALVSFLDGVGDKGLMSVPIIVGVVPQLFIGACMVPCWVHPDDKSGNFAPRKLTAESHGKTSTESLRTNGLRPETDGVGEEATLVCHPHETGAPPHCEDKQLGSYGGV